MMVIYEVNLSIDRAIYTEYTLWLEEHAREMIQFPGFIQALILKQDQGDDSSQEKLTIQYQVESREDLESYLIEFAPKMREEGMKRFKDKFSASRRIFMVQDVLSR